MTIVQPILANAAISISAFKKSPNAALNQANGQPVAVLTNGRISGYYVSPELWEALAEYQEDIEFAKIARSRMKGKRVKVGLDEGMVLVDGERLVHLMIENEVGVSSR